MMQHQIIEQAYAATIEKEAPAQAPYIRNSAEYRYWQDGTRMAMQEVYERQGIE